MQFIESVRYLFSVLFIIVFLVFICCLLHSVVFIFPLWYLLKLSRLFLFQQNLPSFFLLLTRFRLFPGVYTLWLPWALTCRSSVLWLVHLCFPFVELLSKALSTFTLIDSREKPLVISCLGLVYSSRMEHKNKKH